MKIFSLSSILFFIIVFSYCIIAQDVGSIRKISNYSVPEKISAPMGDPLPAGTYSIGSGGYFPTIDSAFNKLSIDGIAGEVTLELIDNIYTAPTETFGFLLIGPITGAGENTRVIIKPAQNHQVTIEGDGGSVLYFSNTSYVTLDGVALTGPTTLTINSFHNSQFTWNDGVDFVDDSDNNIVTNTNFNDEDVARPSTAIGFWTNTSGVIGAPDNNLIENNKIIQGTFAIYVSASWSNVYGFNNIIRDNVISASTGNIISWGIQLEKNENTIIENNVVNNIINSVANLELAFGINAHWCNSCTIRNNIVHSISSNVRNGSTGILLSGIAGKEGYDNMIYNNMIFDIQSTSSNPSSRVAGIQTWQNHNPRVYYNSINLSGSGSNYMGSGALFIRTNTTNIEACDNIFVNTRDESPYCATSIYVYTNPTILTSDYNDLCYQPNEYSCLVRAIGGDYHSLEEWQATGHDMHSISEMPNFLALDDLHIVESIPTNIESGATPIYGINTDFDGDLRNTITPDIGADEFDGIGIDTLYVPGDYATIQEAIDAAINGNVVLVEDGLYYENVNFKGKAITVASHFLVDGDTSHISNTIINGSQPSHPDSGSVVYFISGEDTTSVLCGFTITGGTGTYYALYDDMTGGGIYLFPSGAKICYNIIEYNSISYNTYVHGGGILADIEGKSIIIENNVIRYNTITGNTSASGGGISLYSGSNYARIINNKIIENTVTCPIQAWGGGINCNGTSNEAKIVSNYIKNNNVNSSTHGGGGVSVYNGTIDIINNLIVENSAFGGGGVLVELVTSDLSKSPNDHSLRNQIQNKTTTHQYLNKVNRAETLFENNTIVNNSATVGGGIRSVGYTPELMNCILWGNTAPSGPQISGNADVQYSDVEGGYTGTGNINEDPNFDDSTYFVLNYHSACTDTGNPDPMYNDIEDPQNLGYALLPARGTLRNDMGHMGGPNSLWAGWDPPVSVERDETETGLPTEYTLWQNYPNPFNPSTTIKYGTPERSFVELRVYDILGSEIKTLVNEEKSAGTYELTWYAGKLSSGIYFYQLKAGDFVQMKKMILLK